MKQINDVNAYMEELGRAARAASRHTAAASTSAKNTALLAMAQQIRAQQDVLLAANAADLEEALRNGLEASLIDRLTLSAKSIEAMAQGLEQVAALPDPFNQTFAATRYNDVNILRHGDQATDGSAVGGFDDLHGTLRQAGRLEAVTHAGSNRLVGAQRLLATTQDRGIARL